MNDGYNAPDDDSDGRRRRVVAAALRAAYAWTMRGDQPRAMREVARMTGIVMEAHGPGQGPVTPHALVQCLHRPLGGLLDFAADADEMIRAAVLLDGDGGLTEEAYDLAAEYAMPLSGTESWLPTWTTMHSDQIRNEVFAGMIGTRKQDDYVRYRKFLIEHPAGSREEIGDLLSGSGIRVSWKGYGDVPGGQLYRRKSGPAWWWACPDCRWPMAVTGTKVRCRYRPHAAVFRIVEASDRRPPALRRIDEGPRAEPPNAREAEGSACLDAGVWRFIVVPGASELRVCRELRELGADVRLWPECDAYDLRVVAGGREFRVDLKEYRSPYRLIADLRAKPPRARVLLPRTHQHQVDVIRSALPGLDVVTETRFRSEIRRALKGHR
ncbi:hypothetical protein BTM25_02810 [Actinomadura rubteroloni]|uniref:REase associating with pPIWI RE domain-containing protein n=1 Tax=Actinomadura rubteroloni TaxID=1926885 RepID=A0A2P4ULI1_9ACTN|nr:hypothetical protein [Actinomadura rubteroloni]POM25897.1 hypothetical protein BTM25_02810 [Actinomadura rubteroloni]